jgi:hypothetical protein
MATASQKMILAVVTVRGGKERDEKPIFFPRKFSAILP